MALLLAMYQKMRLIREKNQLVLEQTKVSSKLSRVEKNIERTQKYYTSLFTKLDNDAKRMQNNANIMINNYFGFGTNQAGVNPYNFSGLSQNAMATIIQCLRQGQGQVVNEADIQKYVNSGLFENAPAVTLPNGEAVQSGKKYLPPKNPMPDLSGMLQEYMAGTLTAYYNSGETTQATDEHGLKLFGSSGSYNECAMQLFNSAKMYATQQENMMRGQCNEMQMSSQNNISIWLEAAKQELEDRQDAALEPLNYEQTMLELEKEQKDTRLARINEEIETYKQLVSQEVKNTTPTFGLG